MSKNKKGFTIVLISILALLVFFIFSFKYPSIQTLDKVNLILIKGNIVEAELIATIKNENFMGATLSNMKSNISIDGNFIGEGKSDTPTTINRGLTKVNIKTKIDLASFSKLFSAANEEKKDITIQIDGRYTIKTFFKEVLIAAITEQKMDLHTEIENLINNSFGENGIKIKSINPKNVSIEGSEVEVNVEIINAFPFEYTIESIALDLFMGDSKKKMGTWKMEELKTIKANFKEEMTGNVQVNNLSILGQLGGMFSNKKKKIIAKGFATINISGSTFKFPVKQEVPITKILF